MTNNITSTIIDLAIENLILNSSKKTTHIDPPPTIKEITRNNLNFKTLVSILLLLVYIISAPIFVKINFIFYIKVVYVCF